MRRAVAYGLAVAALAMSVWVAAPPPVEAHDSLAPAGAEHDWLPEEEWVFRHWIPFDVLRLQQALQLSGRDLDAYLFNDHRTLADLVKSRDIDVDELADDLVAPWGSRVDEGRVADLRDRTMRLLTQGHLAQHVFLHVFHTMGAEAAAATAVRLSPAQFRRLRMRGHSGLDIARRRGVPPARVTAGMLELFRRHHEDGIRLQQAWPAQSARVLAEQAGTLRCWMRTPLPTLDSGNPFGKAMRQHGVHAAGWPITVRQQRTDERRVERLRRSLTPSCWRQPRAWRRSPHGSRPPSRANPSRRVTTSSRETVRRLRASRSARGTTACQLPRTGNPTTAQSPKNRGAHITPS
jgi:hypothetical protein